MPFCSRTGTITMWAPESPLRTSVSSESGTPGGSGRCACNHKIKVGSLDITADSLDITGWR
jgi:hypothetical protein